MAVNLHLTMEKPLIFLLFLQGVIIEAQTIEIKEIVFSIWIEDLKDQNHKSESSLLLEFRETSDKLDFNFANHPISQIRKVEGRDKSHFEFKHEKGRLHIKLDKLYHKGDKLKLKFSYRFKIPAQIDIAIYDNINNILALNPNVFMDVDQDLSFNFFPSLNNQQAYIKTNISFPTEVNSICMGELEFITVNGNSISHYWSTKDEKPLRKFFIRVGNFEGFQIKETEDDPLEDVNLIYPAASKRITLRENLEKSFDFYKDKTNLIINDSLIDLIDKLSNKGPDLEFYLQYEDIERAVSRKVFQQEQIMALLASKNDTLKASMLNLEWNIKEHEKSWLSETILDKWPDSVSVSISKITAQTHLHYWKKEIGEILAAHSQHITDSIIKDFSKDLILSGKLPQFEINYRYIDSKKGLFITIEQDTINAQAYSSLLLLSVYLKDTVVNQSFVVRALPKDTIIIALWESPRSAEVFAGEYFPGFIRENKPDAYHLYMLMNAKKEEKRERALVELLETKNENLFSTVLGIAMDNANAFIRLKALNKAQNLKPVAQRKLKDTFKRLSEWDTEERIKIKASELVEKYYPDK